MDFVVGNPPYVRVHNLDISYDEVKKFNFTHRGMTDIYLAFFELGFGMLNPTGKLCYITPSSWLNSLAASKMREYILQKENLVSLTDLEHFQAFENVTTYTIISLFSNCKKDRYFDYFIFNGNKRNRKYVERLSLESCYINGNFYLSNTKDLQKLKQIKEGNFKRYVSVKNGFATLADKIFIGEHIPKTEITIKVFKASTGKWKDCLFPYNEEGKLLPPTVVFGNPKTKDYFEHHKMELLKGRTEYSTYYEYGRTQAVNDVWRNKIAVNLLIRNEEDLRIEDVVKGKGVYSGLYIISDLRLQANDIKKIIKTPSFVKYVQLLKKYKSGGYYTFNSKDLEQFINYVYFLQNTH